jgi:hypothetical protein
MMMVKTSQVVAAVAAASVVSVAMTVAHAKTVVIVAAVIAMIVAVVTVTTVVLVKIVAHAKTVLHVKTALLGVTDQWKSLSRLSLTAKCGPSSATLVPTLVVVATVVETAIAIVAVAK